MIRRAQRAAETAPNSWQFFVEHYANETQSRRDTKYTYILPNGSYHVGADPPASAEPYVQPRQVLIAWSLRELKMQLQCRSLLPSRSDSWWQLASERNEFRLGS